MNPEEPVRRDGPRGTGIRAFVGLLAIINFSRFASEAWHKIDIFQHRPDTVAE